MDESFGGRLKKYRKAKNLTQQDLADRLGVSNKTVSRWESEGGYPDVQLLIPISRVLGVTADDLLDEEKPVRTLTKLDWQNLLSFAFAIGGGVLFFLLKLFMPSPVCYLGYLGCMAYGVYLQRYYSYQSKWFFRSNLVMNFFVNLDLVSTIIMGILALSIPMTDIEHFLTIFYANNQKLIVVGILGTILLLALVLSTVTVYLIAWWSREEKPKSPFALDLRRPTLRSLLPVLGVLVLLAFWLIYLPEEMAREFYLNQRWYYYGLLGIVTVLCVLFSLKKGERRGLIPTFAMVLGALVLPCFMKEYALLRGSNRYMEATEKLSDIFPRFLLPTIELVIACIVLALLCLILSLIQIKHKEAGT